MNTILLEKLNERKYIIHLPDENDTLPSDIEQGFKVEWPVYPHFSGFAVIANLLNADEQFKNVEFIRG